MQELLIDFSGKIFHRLMDYSDGMVVFTFHNGAEVGTKI